jgi:hypothetical protein
VRLLVVLNMICLLLSAFTLFTPASTGHGCAPLAPPTVPGPLAQPPARANTLFINEVLLTPDSRSPSWNCSGSTSPWIEIYNPQNQAFYLNENVMIDTTDTNTPPLHFLHGSAIAAHGYLVVFPFTTLYNKNTVSSTTLRLLISGSLIDEVNVPSLGPDISYARLPDGGTTWQPSTIPTIGASNSVPPTPTTTSRQRSNSTLPTPATTSRQRSTSNGNGGTNRGSNNTADTTSTGSSQDPQGVQPTWSTLQLPTNASPSVASDETAADSPTSTSPPSANTAASDIPRMIVTVLLVIALVLTLLWCWRHLSK